MLFKLFLSPCPFSKHIHIPCNIPVTLHMVLPTVTFLSDSVSFCLQLSNFCVYRHIKVITVGILQKFWNVQSFCIFPPSETFSHRCLSHNSSITIATIAPCCGFLCLSVVKWIFHSNQLLCLCRLFLKFECNPCTSFE